MSFFIIYLRNIFLCVLFICDGHQAFKITTCGSNKISVVSSDPATKKAVIKFDESEKINISESDIFSGDINLYCTSDTLYERCNLSFQKKDALEDETKCQTSVPPKCTPTADCEDNKISRNPGNSNNCSFTLQQLSKDDLGTWTITMMSGNGEGMQSRHGRFEFGAIRDNPTYPAYAPAAINGIFIRRKYVDCDINNLGLHRLNKYLNKKKEVPKDTDAVWSKEGPITYTDRGSNYTDFKFYPVVDGEADTNSWIRKLQSNSDEFRAFSFAVSAHSCYDPQCKKLSTYFPDLESNGCFGYLWQKTKAKDNVFAEVVGDPWYKCYLFKNSYDVDGYGWKLTTGLRKRNSEITAGLHDCHQKNVTDEWGDDTIEDDVVQYDVTITSTSPPFKCDDNPAYPNIKLVSLNFGKLDVSALFCVENTCKYEDVSNITACNLEEECRMNDLMNFTTSNDCRDNYKVVRVIYQCTDKVGDTVTIGPDPVTGGDGHEGIGTLVIVCISVGSVVVLVGIIVAVILIKRKKKAQMQGKKKGPKNSEEQIPLETMDTNTKEISVNAFISNSFRRPSTNEYEELVERDRQRNGLMSDFVSHQGKRHNDGERGRLNNNKFIIPYDFNRIKLNRPINGIDYVNASYIQTAEEHGYDDLYEQLATSKISFLLTQDPNSDTEHHYLQMIHEKQIDMVIHIGSQEEVPKWKKRTYVDVSTKLIQISNLDDHLIREDIEVAITRERVHTATVFHFTAWPSDDKFTDEIAKEFLSAICNIKREIGKPSINFKILAHDKDGGVGGAATFITLYNLMQEIDSAIKSESQNSIEPSETINISKKVTELRNKRAQFISTFNNYNFLFTALGYYAKHKIVFESILTAHPSKPTSRNQLTRGNDIFDGEYSSMEEDEDPDEDEVIYLN